MKNSLHTCLISQLTDQVCMLLNRHVFRESPVAMSIRIKRLKAKPINSWNLRWKLCIQRSHSHVEWTIIVHAIGRSAYLPSATKLRRLCFYTCLSVHSGGVSTSVHTGIPPQYTPPGADTPPQQTATAADGTHPTGMHSCLTYFNSP